LKNIVNNILGISERAKGEVDLNGNVTIKEIISYDFVSNLGFSSASFYILEELQRLRNRQKLLDSRKKKINRLNNLNNEK
jgi:hypothetical protein